MTETPPPRRALATFLRRPGTERAAPAAPVPDSPDVGNGQPAAAAPSAQGPASAAPASVEASPAPVEPILSPSASAGTPSAQPRDGAARIAVPDTFEADALASAAPTAVVRSAPVPVAGEEAATAPATLGPLDASTPPDASPADTPAAERSPRDALVLPLPAGPAGAAAPTFARPRTRVPSPRAPLWQWLALAVLALVLMVQILLADRARLAADAGWRPLLTSLCGALGCTLPPWHEPGAFTMLDRDVRPDPRQNGALRIQASFRNDARWAQAWPWLQLSLSDADGRVIGTRVFAPSEYLGHAPADPELLAPGQSARIDFRVREPAAGTAAFNFEFR